MGTATDSGDFEDKIYVALSHRIRRNVIKLLAEKKKASFSELMKELGVDDTGTLTFHLKKLSGLITKTSSGEYALTGLGKKAYDIMMSIERSGTPKQGSEEQERSLVVGKKVEGLEQQEELKPDLVFIVDRTSLTIDKELLEYIRSQGKKLVVKDVISLEIADNVDPQLFLEVVDVIEDVIELKVPKHLRSVVELKVRDVLTIEEVGKVGRVAGFMPLLTLSMGRIVSNIVEAVSSIVKATTARIPKQLAKVLVYENTFSGVSSVECEVRGGRVRLSQWDEDKTKITIHGYSEDGDRCVYDVDVRGNTMEVEVDGCEVEIAIPRESVSSLSIDAKGGLIEIEQKTALNKLELSISGGHALGKLYNQKNLVFDVSMRGGALDIDLGYSDFEGLSRIDLELMGGYINVDIAVPPNTKVTHSTQNFGGLLRLDVDEELKRLRESRRVIEIGLRVTGGLCNVKVKRVS